MTDVPKATGWDDGENEKGGQTAEKSKSKSATAPSYYYQRFFASLPFPSHPSPSCDGWIMDG